MSYQPPSGVVPVDLSVSVADEATFGGDFGVQALVSGASVALPTSHSVHPFSTQGAQAGDQFLSYSCLDNFILFSTLSNSEIICLIEDFWVVFHTIDAKKELIVQDIKNMKFSKFTFFGGLDLNFKIPLYGSRGYFLGSISYFLMIILSWNMCGCRSLAKHYYLKELLVKEHIDIVCF
jgi:hypothetical protein